MTILDRLLPTVGDLIEDRYEVIREIDRGGFGVVVAARQRGLDEVVSLKILLPHVLTKPELAKRFEREVRLAKGLRHPNTIRVLDVGTTAGGLPFYVMEYVEGLTLKQLLREEIALSPKRARRVCLQVAKSLAEAHSKGIVHRDLKPSNLMLCRIVGERDFIKVLDFGIAKALRSAEDELETVSGVVLGTPAYMSPEQARGSKTVDQRSDLYSLGLILSECVSGVRVVVGSTMYDAVSQHASQDPLRFPDTVQDSALWEIIRKATAKEIELRFSSAEEMADALEDLQGLSNEVIAVAIDDFEIVEDFGPQATPITVRSTPTPSQLSDSALRFREDVNALKAGSTTRGLLVIGALGAFVALGIWLAYDSSGGRGEGLEEPALVTVDSEVDPEGPAELAEITAPTATEQQTTANQHTAAVTDGTFAVGEAPADSPDIEAALAASEEALHAGVPNTQTVRFTGQAGVTVRHGDHVLGEIPFDSTSAVLDVDVRLTASRRRYESERVTVSLMASDDVNIALDRRRDDDDDDGAQDGAPAEEGDSDVQNLPFGGVQLYDGD